MAWSFMTMLRAGPEVSFRGSPTVSPTTAALWQSLPLPPYPALGFSSMNSGAVQWERGGGAERE